MHPLLLLPLALLLLFSPAPFPSHPQPLHDPELSQGAYSTSLRGEDLVSFLVGNCMAWWQDQLALHVWDTLNCDKVAANTLENLLNHTCIQNLQTLLCNGKEVMEKQGEAPNAKVSPPKIT